MTSAAVPSSTYLVSVRERTGTVGVRGTVRVPGYEHAHELYDAAVAAVYGGSCHYAQENGLKPNYGHVAWPEQNGQTTQLGAAIRLDVEGETNPTTLSEAWGHYASLAGCFTFDWRDRAGEAQIRVFSGQDAYARAAKALRTIRGQNVSCLRVTGSWRDGEITRTTDIATSDD